MPENNMEEVYHSKNPLVSFVHTQRLEKIIEAIPGDGKKRVLDAGCGEGHLISMMHDRFPSFEYAGIDITDVALQKARERCKYATLTKMDLDDIKYPDGHFDVVICTEVLEHIYEYRAVIEELKRVTKRGGLLIITHPNEVAWTMSRLVLGRNPIRVPDHVNAFTPGHIRKTVGFPAKSKNLPFGLPFAFSLTGMHVFRKE
jgi:2-polyprenyl-3-methyl-5-hydroxy-6-metoxy-1,4-benzoquinol methylase